MREVATKLRTKSEAVPLSEWNEEVDKRVTAHITEGEGE